MKAWVWLIIASVGFAVMVWAYASREQIDDKAPWASGVIIMSARGAAEKTAARGSDPCASATAVIERRGRDVAVRHRRRGPGQGPRRERPGAGQADRAAACGSGHRCRLLQSGRLPEPGRNEILAGAKVEQPETRIVGGESLKVVGVLEARRRPVRQLAPRSTR